MSVLGIDVGASNCVVATIQHNAVTVVANDLSERLTPCLVSFTEHERLIGEYAQQQIFSHYKNTCRNIKQLLGCTRLDESDLAVEQKHSLCTIGVTGDDEGALPGHYVSYLKETQLITAVQSMAAVFTRMKALAEKATGIVPREAVISVPGWFSDQARQAMLDAAGIAGLNCLRTMNEHAAVALDYGIHRSNAFDAVTASRVAFVGVGHSNTNVSVVDFVKGELRVLGVTSDRTFGGRDIDFCIAKHLADQFEKAYGSDPTSDKKAFLKLEEAARNAKKVLSANTEVPIYLECLLKDKDVNALLTREELEELCKPYKKRLESILRSTFVDNGLNPQEVHHIELVGGCTRIPWIQQTVSRFFENRLPLGRTLNMDESAARGCALQAAILDSRYRVRPFNVVDCLLEPVTVSWASTTAEEGAPLKRVVLFEKGSPLGTKKSLTFQRSADFEVVLSPGTKSTPCVCRIGLPAESLSLEAQKRVKVKVHLTLNGTAFVESAQLLVDEELEEVVKEKKPVQPAVPRAHQEEGSEQPESSTAPADAASVGVAGVPEPEFEEDAKKRVRTRKLECSVAALPRIGYLQRDVRTKFADMEVRMITTDEARRDARAAMYELETLIYQARKDLGGGPLDVFATQREITSVFNVVDAVEATIDQWHEFDRREFEKMMEKLNKVFMPIQRRALQHSRRQQSMQELRETFSQLQSAASASEWSHIEHTKLKQLLAKVKDTENWLDEVSKKSKAEPLFEDPTVGADDIVKEREALENFSKTILVPRAAELPAPPGTPTVPGQVPKEGATSGKDGAVDVEMGTDEISASPGAAGDSNSDVPIN